MTLSASRDARLSSWRGTSVPPATPANTGVEGFVQAAVHGRAVYAVVGHEGIAAVPSPRHQDRYTYLFWSTQAEAERWADVLAKAPRIVAIDLASFIAVTLQQMAEAEAIAGVDWSADPEEAEVRALALGGLLREALAHDCAALACKTRMIFLLEREGAPATVSTPDGHPVLPIWADRHMADMAAASIGDPSLSVVRKPLMDLTNRYLLSTDGLRNLVSPGYVHAPDALKLSAWALKALLHTHTQIAQRGDLQA